MNIKIFEENFNDFFNEWDLLLNRYENKNIFFTPIWHKLWWNSFSYQSELKLLSVNNGDKLIGVAPLMIKDKCLTFIGDTDLFDYHDVFVVNYADIAYEYLWEYIKNLDWNQCVFKSLPSDSKFFNFLKNLNDHTMKIDILEEDSVPVLNLHNNWEEYLGSLNKKRRHELKRKFRRLNETSSLKQYFSNDKLKFDSDLEEFFRLLKLSSNDKLEFLTEERQLFFTNICKELFLQNRLKLYFMEIESIKVAACICFDYNNVYWLYNSGYDPNYSNLSVGLLNKALCIKDSIELKYDKFNFLRGAERYKYSLGGEDEKIYQISVTR